MKYNPIKVNYMEVDKLLDRDSMKLSSKMSECKLNLFLLDKRPTNTIEIDKDEYKNLLTQSALLYILENSSKGLSEIQLIYKKTFEDYLEQFKI